MTNVCLIMRKKKDKKNKPLRGRRNSFPTHKVEVVALSYQSDSALDFNNSSGLFAGTFPSYSVQERRHEPVAPLPLPSAVHFYQTALASGTSSHQLMIFPSTPPKPTQNRHQN